ncbi:MAG: hypothetical protein HGA76_08205 [Candidatus Firestonebacteria bacterium]|nr:hypothetical protein [Candidatus Firestonebacteria bacterium]
MKPNPRQSEEIQSDEWKLIFLSLGIFSLAAFVALVSFSSPTPRVGDKVFLYLFAFLGLGLLAAMIIHRWFERLHLNREDDEWL